MHELFYCSLASRPMSKENIFIILETSRINNEKLGVTGMLLYYDKTKQFMQILEGDTQIILNLFEKICRDDRHSSIKLIYDGEISERSFSNWTMGFTNFSSLDHTKLEGFSYIFENGITDELLDKEPTIAIRLFQYFKSITPS